ncbi:MAG TPA: glycosyltransferase [Candidatus Limnocylindria bacterium]|jgi:glycosyltransferase involved in cell wall biosynthesis
MSVEPRVSVVVAVYNAGEYLEVLVGSLLAQSLAPGEFEVIFVDDGSTDGSGDRVEALAAAHPHMRAIHIPNSGWPGRPRNIGVDAARGRYVYFVDHDDWIAPEALERLADRADRNDADVVIGKEVAHGSFGVPLIQFARSIDDEPFPSDVLVALLTPHKLFRRSMLVERGIRFPEGRRRLEDHHFVIQAYFAARRISILADYPCYHWIERREKANATHLRIDPVGYYANMREILDIVDANTEPGDARDHLYAHWFRGKTLHKLRGPRWFASTLSRDARRLLDEVRHITADRFGPAIDRHVGLRYRIVASAVRSHNDALLATHARFTQGIGLDIGVRSIEPGPWRLDLDVDLALHGPDGVPLQFERRNGVTSWLPPVEFEDTAVGPGDLVVDDAELERTALNVLARHRGTWVTFHTSLPFGLKVSADGLMHAAGSARLAIDLATLAAGGPLPDGTWDLFVQFECCGWRGSRRIPGLEMSTAATQGLPTRPYVTSAGTLALVVEGSAAPRLTGPPEPAAPINPPLTSTDRLRRTARRLPRPVRRVGRAFLDLRPGR